MKNIKNVSQNKGFTLIEILVVIGIIAVLATIVLIAINPARQFAQARDSQRISNLNSILNAIGQRIADNKGTFAGSFTVGTITHTCSALPTVETSMDSGSGGSGFNISCLVPTYIPALPTDPTAASGVNIGYNVYQDTIGRVHVIANATEPAVTRTESIEVVR